MTKKDVLEEDLELTAITGTTAPPVQLPEKVLSVFPALAHRNFQLYFVGQSISLIGFWLQQIGMGWLVFQLTHSAFWVGTVAAVGGIPFLLFTTFAGVFVDKLDKRKLLIWTQTADAVVAAVIGISVLTNTASLPLLIATAFASGTINALDLPARLTFIVEMVGKKDLPSAIPINNGVFNAARFAGPALAGALIASVGIGWAFIINAVSFIPAIFAIYIMKPAFKYDSDEEARPIESLKIGLKYSFTHPKILYFMILAFINGALIWPYQTLMPVVASEIFKAGPGIYGALLSAAGAGSLTGAIFTSSQSKRKNKEIFVILGLIISSFGLLIFSLNRNFYLSLVLLFIIGFGILIQVSTLNTLVQLSSPDKLRGRIMAVYLTMFIGMMPVGNQLAGMLAHRTSAMFTIAIGAALTLIIGSYFYYKGISQNRN